MDCRLGSMAVLAIFLSGCVEISHLLHPEPSSSSVYNVGHWQDSGVNGDDNADDSANDNADDSANDNDGDANEDGEDADSPIFGGIGGIPPTAGLKPVITTDSGLKYIDFQDGQGDHPLPTSLVTVSYTGWLTDGSEFDSADAAQFYLNQVIGGWTEGVGSMQLGGRRRLMIPPELGYGEAGSPPSVPGSATLIFDVELMSITPAATP